MIEQAKPWGLLAGRTLLSAVFLFSGAMKITNWSQTSEQMRGEGMVLIPLFLVLAILFEIGGGWCVLLGYRARLGALALIVFLIPTTLIFHDFWNYRGIEQMNQLQHFLKNLTIAGGLATLAVAGAGAYSLDAVPVGATPRTHMRRDEIRAAIGR